MNFFQYLVQRKPLKVIPLAQDRTDNIYQLMTKPKYTTHIFTL